jgi:hypothetical protein
MAHVFYGEHKEFFTNGSGAFEMKKEKNTDKSIKKINI